MCVSSSLDVCNEIEKVGKKQWDLTVINYLILVISLIHFFYISENQEFSWPKVYLFFLSILCGLKKGLAIFFVFNLQKSLLLLSVIIIILIISGSLNKSQLFFTFYKTSIFLYCVAAMHPSRLVVDCVPLGRFLPTEFLSDLYSWRTKDRHCCVPSFSQSANYLFKLQYLLISGVPQTQGRWFGTDSSCSISFKYESCLPLSCL